MGLITLANPTDGSGPVQFRQPGVPLLPIPDKIDTAVRAFEFVRLIRFIRLWKKLGWTIEQTDKAITALYPADQIPDDPDDAVNLQRLDAGFLTLLPRLGVVRRVMDALEAEAEEGPAAAAGLLCADRHARRRLPLPADVPQPGTAEAGSAFADDGFGNFLTAARQEAARPRGSPCAPHSCSPPTS